MRSITRIVARLVLVVLISTPALAQQEQAGQTLGTVDQFHGTFQTSIPIRVPPYHGIEPKLALTYNSGAGNGFVGVGWSLSGFSRIERASPGYGAPRYDDNDLFLLDGELLVPCVSGSLSPSCNNPDGGAGLYYSTKHESFLRIKRSDFPTPTWTVWDKEGNKTTYDAVWKTTEWGVPYRTYRWGVVRVEDANGNRVNYQWACDYTGGQNSYDFDCQPRSVFYGDSSPTVADGVTVMLYPTTSARPDPVVFGIGQLYHPSVSHAGTPIGRTRFVLQSVDVVAGGLCDLNAFQGTTCPYRARSYGLGYTLTGTSRYALTRVREYGKDAVLNASAAVVGGTALPDQTFTYAPHVAAFLTEFHGSTSWGDGSRQRWVDIDGDREADYCRVNHYSGGTNLVCVPNPPGSAVFGTTSFNSQNILVNGFDEVDAGADWADLNGDGRADYCRPLHRDNLASTNHLGRVACVLSTGTGFGQQVILDGEIDFGQTHGRAWVDFNGDGRSDYCRISGDDGAHGVSGVSCFLSTCVSDPSNPGWCASGGLFRANQVAGSLEAGYDVGRGWADVNGDGKADYCRLGGNESNMAIQCNTSLGTGFAPLIAAIADWGPDEMRDSIAWTDFNGDGKSDFCRIVGGIQRNVNTQLACTLSTGAGWDVAGTIVSGIIDSGFDDDFPDGLGGTRSDPIRRWVDFNGDGRADFCRLIDVVPDQLHMACQVTKGGAGFGEMVVSELLDRFLDYAYRADQWTDIDGNGAWDFCRIEDAFKDNVLGGVSDPQPECRWSQNLFPDLLIDLYNGLGGRVHIDYKSSTEWSKDPSSPPVPLFRTPYRIQTYPRVDVEPTTRATTTYTFGHGVYDRAERRFLGYRHGRQVTDCVPDGPGTINSCPVTDIFYRVDGGSTPRPEVEWTYNTATPPPLGTAPAPTAMLEASVHIYAEGGLGPEASAPFVVSEVARYDYRFQEGAPGCPSTWPKGTTCASGIRRLTETTMDVINSLDLSNTVPGGGSVPTLSESPVVTWKAGFGVPSVIEDWGDYDVNGDERTIANYYYREPAAFLLRPAKSDLWAGEESTPRNTPSRPLIGKTLFFYDRATCQTEVGDGYMAMRAPQGTQSCSQGGIVPLSRGNQTSISRWDGTNLLTRTFEYDDNRTNCSTVPCAGNMTAEIDEMGNRTGFLFDTTYGIYVVRTTNALNQAPVSNDLFDFRCGTKTVTYDLNNLATTTTLDALCRPIRTDSPGKAVVLTKYRDFGSSSAQYVETETATAVDSASPPNVTSSVWKRGYFDGLGRTYRTVTPGPTPAQSIQTDTQWDLHGSVSAQSHPYFAGSTPRWTTTWHDASDRPVRVQHPDGAFVTFVYGVGGGSTSKTTIDESNHAQKQVFDGHDRLIEHGVSTTAYPGVTWDKATYEYNLLGQRLVARDPAGNSESYEYDQLGRRLATTTPDSGRNDFRYDAAGRLVWAGDNESFDQMSIEYYQSLDGTVKTAEFRQVMEYSYDALGRKTGKLMQKNVPLCAIGTHYPTGRRSWVYDEARIGTYNGNPSYVFSNKGRLTSAADAIGSDTFDYDDAGRMVRRSRTVDGTTYTFEWGFDVSGRLLWTKYPDGTSVGTAVAPRTYDAAGRPFAIPGFIDQAQYDASGRALSWTNLSSPTTVTTRTYSADRGWLTSVKTEKPLKALYQDETYYYRPDGQLWTTYTPFQYEGWTYGYDGKHQLLSAINGTHASQDRTYGYGNTQNLISDSHLGTHTYGTGIPTGFGNEIQCAGNAFTTDRAGVHAITSSTGGYLYRYDLNGNVVQGNTPASGAFRALYDVDRSLMYFSINGFETWYDYDADGNRIREWYITGAGTPYPKYYIGDDYEVSGGQAIKYIRLGSHLVAKMMGSTKNWLHTGREGTLQAITNVLGNSIRRRRFFPYGEEVYVSGAQAESHGFIGERRDASGLMFLHSRYYEPILGRFFSPDSIAPTTAPIGLNRYAYANNDPVNLTDRTGNAVPLLPMAMLVGAEVFTTGQMSKWRGWGFAISSEMFQSAPVEATNPGKKQTKAPSFAIAPLIRTAEPAGEALKGGLELYNANGRWPALGVDLRLPLSNGSSLGLFQAGRTFMRSEALGIGASTPTWLNQAFTGRNLARFGTGLQLLGMAAEVHEIDQAPYSQQHTMRVDFVGRRASGQAFGTTAMVGALLVAPEIALPAYIIGGIAGEMIYNQEMNRLDGLEEARQREVPQLRAWPPEPQLRATPP